VIDQATKEGVLLLPDQFLKLYLTVTGYHLIKFLSRKAVLFSVTRSYSLTNLERNVRCVYWGFLQTVAI
jgi:hypothetical protein